MSAFLKRSLPVFILLSAFASIVMAQKPLTPSRQSSYYTYLYKLSPADVLQFYKYPTKTPDDKTLRNPVDSFKTYSHWENTLPAGNYLKVFADKNELSYSLVQNRSAYLKLISNNYDLRFILTDKQGTPITNALVQLNNKAVIYDAKSGLYIASQSKKDTVLKVDYAGVTNYFSVKQQKLYRNYYGYNHQNWFKLAWYRVKNIFRDKYKYQKQQPGYGYGGFMVFNKAIYKPNDTVKLKAFIVKAKSKQPINVPQLLVRLSSGYNDNGKVIGRVNGYRDGAYEYSFVLNDSLKLSLDDEYTISLEDPSSLKYNLDNYDGDNDHTFLAKRKVYLTGKFHYEEYELKSIKFSTRTDKKDHSPGNPLALYIKAVDENNLPVPDGRVTVTLTTRKANNYNAKQVFVPDTLWTHKMPLDPVGETKLMIPDSIFPKASIDYDIRTGFLNSDNENQYEDNSVTYNYNPYIVTANLNADTLIATYQVNGKDTNKQAIISATNAEDDTLSKVHVTLPAKIIINPNAYSYNIETDSAYTDLDLKENESGIALSGYRTADSVFVKVDNPRRLHVWYSVFGGDKLIDAGQGDNFTSYAHAYHQQNNISFLAHYIWGGESKTETTNVVYQDKLLSINVKQPVSVYPGQRAKTDIVVTNAFGKPVANADLTAWSMTSKFSDYHVPFVPYLGKMYPNRKSKRPFENEDINGDGNLKLNWERWSSEIGLDSIAYYQFTHPQKIYKIEEDAPDTTTQIAPFIVKNGDIVPVRILYIDGRPVYFDQTEQLKRYSFAVSPGLHVLRLRTSHQSIRLDSVFVQTHKKLIISINAGTANATAESDTLSGYEADLINKYLITVINNFGWKKAMLEQTGRLFMLNPNPHSRYAENPVLTGPLFENYAQLELQGEQTRAFISEPGYSFRFEPGLLKQKSIPTKYPFNTILSSYKGEPDYTQYVLTKPGAETIWEQYLDLRSNTEDLFHNDPIDDKLTGRLSFDVHQPKKYELLIKNVIIYKYNEPDYIRIYKGSTSDIDKLAVGNYRILFLLKGDAYDIKENVSIKPNGINYYKFDVLPVHAKDSVSIKIAAIINSRNAAYEGKDYDIENDALKIKEAFNEKYLNTKTFNNSMAGVVAYNKNVPMPGVTIRVKGTKTGTVSDVNGRFIIKVPSGGKLVFSFIGFDTKETAITPGNTVKINLNESSKLLQEVVVVGYGVQMRKSITGSVSTVYGNLAGYAPGLMITQSAPGVGTEIMIRGMATSPSAKPLIVVDGEIVDSMNGIDPATVGDMSILKDAAATALYGARAANGVIIINTKKKQEPSLAQKADSIGAGSEFSYRKNFSDYAYWQPKLTTDENGMASFTTTYPDDITNWRTFVIGINDKQQTGFTQGNIKAFKPLSANFIAPQFAVAGDEMNLIGKVMNYNSTSAKVSRTFSYNDKQLRQDSLLIKNSKIDTLGITATPTDSLTFEYAIKRNNGYFDGEQRKIPVIKQGVEETKGIFEALNRDTTVSLKFNPVMGPVTFRAEASVLPTLLEETKHLREYKYLCNEQLASKLKGLLLEKRVDAFLNQPFKWDKNVKEVIKKLQENRKSQGTWGWWKDTGEELWISLHAVEALIDAQKEGYTVELDKQKLTDYLVYQMESLHSEDKLICLRLLHKLDAKVDYQKYIGLIEKDNARTKTNLPERQLTSYDKMRLMLERQQAGLPVNLDSLVKVQRRTLFGNIYWGEESYSFFDNSVQLSVLAYQIIKNEGKNADLLTKIRGYFLEQRRLGEWRNTYESALILQTILPDLLVDSKEVKPSSITIKGSKTETINKFPYTATLTDNEVMVSKTGALPVYITGYQQFWNSKPEKVSKDFIVNTWFEKSGSPLTQLKGGEPVLLKAEVTAKGDADFVMIEIPIPAGCSYESKDQALSNNEVHREYFKEKVSIFCRKLKQGKYTFTVNLIPRYDGKYNLNPTKAEMMYFPVFYGREGMKKVVIGE